MFFFFFFFLVFRIYNSNVHKGRIIQGWESKQTEIYCIQVTWDNNDKMNLQKSRFIAHRIMKYSGRHTRATQKLNTISKITWTLNYVQVKLDENIRIGDI